MNASIGVFDSGIGGLTVMKEIMRQLPNENTIYFGDTARVPYGGKSKNTVLKYSRQIVRFLQTKKVKAIVVACNTASALALDEIRDEIDIPIIGVVEPGAVMAAAMTKNNHIGIIGTDSTIKSGIYNECLRKIKSDITVVSKACPLFVPLVEEGLWEDRVTEDIATRYLHELKEYHIDTLILGCTHYPLLRRMIGKEMGESVKLVNPAFETAKRCKELLNELGILNNEYKNGFSEYKSLFTENKKAKYEYYVSDGVEKFITFAGEVLPLSVEETNVIDIESY